MNEKKTERCDGVMGLKGREGWMERWYLKGREKLDPKRRVR